MFFLVIFKQCVHNLLNSHGQNGFLQTLEIASFRKCTLLEGRVGAVNHPIFQSVGHMRSCILTQRGPCTC